MNDQLLKVIKETLPEMQVEAITEMSQENKELKENVSLQASTIKSMEENQKHISEAHDQTSIELNKALGKIIQLEDREAVLVKREKDVLAGEIKHAVAIAVSEEKSNQVSQAVGMFRCAFANRTVREDVLKHITTETPQYDNIYNQNGYTDTKFSGVTKESVPVTETKTVVEE